MNVQINQNNQEIIQEQQKEKLHDILSLIVLLENDSELPEIYRRIIRIIHQLLREILRI